MAKVNPLIQLGGAPVTTATLASCFPELEAPNKKIQALERNEDIFRLRRGLYVVNPKLNGNNINNRFCASQIYGPSYISMHYALWWYGLIPEFVYTVTSMTIKRSRLFKTKLGCFEYNYVNPNYFPIGLRLIENDDCDPYYFATPEKALCDFILMDYMVPTSIKGLWQYLEEDIRFDVDEVKKFDVGIIAQCAEKGDKQQVFTTLIKIIKRLKK